MFLTSELTGNAGCVGGGQAAIWPHGRYLHVSSTMRFEWFFAVTEENTRIATVSSVFVRGWRFVYV